MNFNIEIDEEVFREVVTSDIKSAIINKVAHYKTKELIKGLIDGVGMTPNAELRPR